MRDLELPDRHRELLQRGPKYCVELGVMPAEKVELSRSLALQVKDEENPRCVTECVEVFACRDVRQTETGGFGPLIRFLANNGSRVAVSDKEDFSVVLPEGMFVEKAQRAIKKNLREVREKATVVNRRAVKLLGD